MHNSISSDGRFSFADSDGGSAPEEALDVARRPQLPTGDQAQPPVQQGVATWKSRLRNFFRHRQNPVPEPDAGGPLQPDQTDHLAPGTHVDETRRRTGRRNFFRNAGGISLKDRIKAPFKKLQTGANNGGVHVRVHRKTVNVFSVFSHTRQETVKAKQPATKYLNEMNLSKAPVDAECELRQPIQGPGKFEEVKDRIAAFPKKVANDINASFKQLTGSAQEDDEGDPLDAEDFTASFDRCFPARPTDAQDSSFNQARDELKRQLQALPEASSTDLTTLSFALAATSSDSADNALRALAYLRDTNLVSALASAYKEFSSPRENRLEVTNAEPTPAHLELPLHSVLGENFSLLDELEKGAEESNDEDLKFYLKGQPRAASVHSSEQASVTPESTVSRSEHHILPELDDIKDVLDKLPDDVYQFLAPEEARPSGPVTDEAGTEAGQVADLEIQRSAWRAAQLLAGSPIGRSALRAVATANPEHHHYDSHEVVFTDFLKIGNRIIQYDSDQSPIPGDMLRNTSERVPALTRDGMRAMAHRLAENDDIRKISSDEIRHYRYARNGLEKYLDKARSVAASLDKWIDRSVEKPGLRSLFHKSPLAATGDEAIKQGMAHASTSAVPEIIAKVQAQKLVRDALKMLNDQRLGVANAEPEQHALLPLSDGDKAMIIRDVVREAILAEVWCKKTPIEVGAGHQFTKQDRVNITAFVSKRIGDAKNDLSTTGRTDIEAAVNESCGKENIWVDRIPTTKPRYVSRQIASIPKLQASQQTLETWWKEAQEAWTSFSASAQDIDRPALPGNSGVEKIRQLTAKFGALETAFKATVEGMQGNVSLHELPAQMKSGESSIEATDWSTAKPRNENEVRRARRLKGMAMVEKVKSTLISGGASFGDRRVFGLSTNHPIIQKLQQVANALVVPVPLVPIAQVSMGDEGVFSYSLNGAYAEIRIDKYKNSLGAKLGVAGGVGASYGQVGLSLNGEASVTYDVKNVESLSFRFTRNTIPPRGMIRDKDENPVRDEKGAIKWEHNGQKGGLGNDHKLMEEISELIMTIFTAELTEEEKTAGMTILDKWILSLPDHGSVNYTEGGWSKKGNKNHLFTGYVGGKAVAGLPLYLGGSRAGASGSTQWRGGWAKRKDKAGAMPSNVYSKKNQKIASAGGSAQIATKNGADLSSLTAAFANAEGEYSVDFLNRGKDYRRLLAFQEGELADGSSAAEIYWSFSELEEAVAGRLDEFVERLAEGPREELKAERTAQHWAVEEERFWAAREEQWSTNWDASNPPGSAPDEQRSEAKAGAKQEAKAAARAEFRELNSEEIKNFVVELDEAEVQEVFEERLEMLRRSLTQLQTARTAIDSFTLFTKLKPESYNSYNFHKTIESISEGVAGADENARRELANLGQQSASAIKKMKLKDPSNNDPWDVLFVLMSRQYEASRKNTFNAIASLSKQATVTAAHLAHAIATSTPKPL